MALNTSQFYNRDLSWLRFNHRVLQEANDERNPLYERIKFLAIFSSNLDEFFKVRVSDMRQIQEIEKPFRKKLITKPNKLLKAIKKEVDQQQKQFGQIFKNNIIPALENENIHLITYNDFNEEQERFSEHYYKNELDSSSLIHTSEDQLFIENEVLYLVAQLPDTSLIWVKIESKAGRFVTLPQENHEHCITFLDDILKHNLKKQYEVDFYAIKISRDAELYIDDEYSGNLLEKIKNSLPKRAKGQVTRALIDEHTPKALLTKLNSYLNINETDIVLGAAYHNFKDFFEFPNPTSKDFTFKELPPLSVPELEVDVDVLSEIAKKDHLLHFPYQSYQPILNLMQQAAKDATVKKIKITLYRVSQDSKVAAALLKAVENGKSVFVFIETKARFDEENNIKWGKKLEEAGANVIYSYPGIKVHSKILYIERIENSAKKAYAYISTGNFNEKTSKIYTDYGLLTANHKITAELSKVFQVLQRKIIIPKTKKLLISPFTTRSKFTELIANEITNAKEGKNAYITIKMNSLQDKKMIKLLYKANNAGVKIRLLVRGICCLVPGIQGQSEHIKITTIVDRFLEHGRLYVFCNDGKEKIYMGSADWMTRNLDHRIEVLTPILDNSIQKKLKTFLKLQLEDTVKARFIDQEQSNTYVSNGDKGESSQHLIYYHLQNIITS